MFEKIEVITEGQAPIEFTFRGRRFRIHSVLSRWHESGGWWNRISQSPLTPDDQMRTFFTVEATPIGVLSTFQLVRNETTGEWEVHTL